MYIDTGVQVLVGQARAGVWMGLELDWRWRECKMYEGIVVVYVVLVKGLRFVLCLTETCC